MSVTRSYQNLKETFIMQTLSKTLKSIKETPQDRYEMIDIIPVVDKN